MYGAQPAIAADPTIRHEGRVSLRISAGEPSDTALGQEVDLQPGRWYCLTGWIRTENLDPRGSSTCGTLQVQLPGGQGVVAAGKNHPGTNDWIQETIYFTPPGDGRTRISVFFVGYGKGTGTAWFDGLSVHEVNAVVSKLTVTSEPICGATISPYQYGQFIEYLCGLTPSMFAEQVFDGSFEGVPPYCVEFRKDTDRLEKPWYPDGAVHRGDFALIRTRHSMAKLPNASRRGRAIPARWEYHKRTSTSQRENRCDVTCTSVPEDYSHPCRWRSGATARPMRAPMFQPTEQWRRFETILEPNDSDPLATLSISFRGPGTLWIDQVSLMTTDNVCGWRRDVAEALKDLRPGIIRFGGSTTEGFDWTATIGDAAKRVPFTTCWGGLEPGNAGLEEFVQLCRWVGAEPLICVRFTGRTPKQAADQVEYFNGSATTPMGQLRAVTDTPNRMGCDSGRSATNWGMKRIRRAWVNSARP